jgi:hypothetical protein
MATTLATKAQLFFLINDFSSRVPSLYPLRFPRETLDDIRNEPEILASLKMKCGIYYFSQSDEIVYVGRALPSVGLASRISNQITAYGDPKWDTVIKEPKTEIGYLIFHKKDWYFISALEHFLIEQLGRPKFNKRC